MAFVFLLFCETESTAESLLDPAVIQVTCPIQVVVCSLRRSGVNQTARAVVRTGSTRNLNAATTPSATKSASTTSCVNRNGGSDCVGARAFRKVTFWKAWTTPTKTLR